MQVVRFWLLCAFVLVAALSSASPGMAECTDDHCDWLVELHTGVPNPTFSLSHACGHQHNQYDRYQDFQCNADDDWDLGNHPPGEGDDHDMNDGIEISCNPNPILGDCHVEDTHFGDNHLELCFGSDTGWGMAKLNWEVDDLAGNQGDSPGSNSNDASIHRVEYCYFTKL